MPSDEQLAKQANQMVQHLPDEIQIKQNVANAMMGTAQEYTLAVEQVLSDMGWGTKELTDFEYRLKELLAALGKVHDRGLNVMNRQDMENVAKIAKHKLLQETLMGKGVQLPNSSVSSDPVAKFLVDGEKGIK